MHLPAIRCNVREDRHSASRAAHSSCCSLSSLSYGTREVVASESPNIPICCCGLIGRKSHFLADRK